MHISVTELKLVQSINHTSWLWAYNQYDKIDWCTKCELVNGEQFRLSPRGRDWEKCCFFRTRASWLCVNFSIQYDKIDTYLSNRVSYKRRTVQSSPRGRHTRKLTLRWHLQHTISVTKLTNEVVHISVTVWARAKRRTVQSSPRGRDCEKCCFFRTRASWNC